MLNSQVSREVASICRFVTGHSRVHAEPVLLPGHVWRESPHPQKATTMATELAQYLFPLEHHHKHLYISGMKTRVSLSIAVTCSTLTSSPDVSMQVKKVERLTFSSSCPPIHCLLEPETPTAEAKGILEIQPN